MENVIELFNEILLKIKDKVNNQKVILFDYDDPESSNKILHHSKIDIENNEEKKLSEDSVEAFSSPYKRDEEKFMQSNSNFHDQIKTLSVIDEVHLDLIKSEIEIKQRKHGETLDSQLFKQKSNTLASILPELDRNSFDNDNSEKVKRNNIDEQFKSDEIQMDAKDTDSSKAKENEVETSDAPKPVIQQNTELEDNQKQILNSLEGIRKFESWNLNLKYPKSLKMIMSILEEINELVSSTWDDSKTVSPQLIVTISNEESKVFKTYHILCGTNYYYTRLMLK